MTNLGRRMAGRVMEWTAVERSHAVVMLVLIAVYGLHTLVWCIPQPWYIEDAAITFSYARNFANGDGLVPYPGGERVEGYSNPTWTALLAFFYLLRLDPWVMAKVLGFAFGAATLPIAYALARRSRPGPPDHGALLGPVLLGCSTQFVLWNTSGLENSLFSFLVAACALRVTVEIQDGDRRPWSAVLAFLLSATRPDGVLYAAVILLARLVATAAYRQWAALPLWILAFAAPYAAYNAWRFDYFGWWWPNTYYAKAKDISLTGWNVQGWKQIKDWATQYLVVYSAPFLILALTGTETAWRRRLAFGLTLLLGVLLVWDGREFVPSFALDWWSPNVSSNWSAIIVYSLLGGSVLLGLVTLTRPGWPVRAILWAAFCGGIFFWVWSGLEWMKGFRWGSLVAVPLFILMGLGIAEWIRRAPVWLSAAAAGAGALLTNGAPGYAYKGVDSLVTWIDGLFNRTIWAEEVSLKFVTPSVPVQWTGLVAVGLLLVLLGFLFERRGAPPEARRWHTFARPGGHAILLGGVLLIPNIAGSWKLANSPETSPNQVHRRVNYMKEVQRKLGLEHVTLLDVDMGAHLWWASDWKIADMAGLIDVPMARHPGYAKSFIDEYVFTELQPDFAHVHGSWAKTTRIPQNPKWKERYLEIPGYSSGGRTLHVGNHVRRDLLMGVRSDTPAERQVVFSGGIVLDGWNLPAPIVASGGKLTVHTTWRVLARRSAFRVVFFLSDDSGHVHSAEVAPAFGWHATDKWKPGEYVYGRWSIPIPESIAPGVYDLGFVVIDQDSGRPEWPLPPGVTSATEEDRPTVAGARFMRGEWRSEGVVTVGTVDQALAAANETYEAALAAAASGDCEVATDGFTNARRYVARNHTWFENRKDAIQGARVGCLLRRAEALDDRLARASVLVAAGRIDHRNADLQAASRALGGELEALGHGAMVAEDWERTYEFFAGAVAVDPTRSVARRHAETARNKRLGLEDPTKKEPAAPTPKAGTRKVPATPDPEPELEGDGAPGG